MYELIKRFNPKQENIQVIKLILVHEFFMEKLNLQSIAWNNYLK